MLALTPVATLMFRFNNPDALLVLLMVLGAYATVRALERASARWLALAGRVRRLRVPDQDAASAAGGAAGLQLATQLPVMAIGGFNGSDPAPTLAQFQEYVAAGKIHYFVGGSGFRANGGSQDAQAIAAWVANNFTATTVGTTTVYNLTLS